MTNRAYIEILHHLPKNMGALLQPFFPTLTVWMVPVHIDHVEAYGRDWKAVSNGHSITIDADYWKQVTTNSFLQQMAHELTHIEQYIRHGWLRWTWRGLVTVARSIRHGSFYRHDLSPDEQEAENRRIMVYLALSDSMPAWENMLDSPMDTHQGG